MRYLFFVVLLMIGCVHDQTLDFAETTTEKLQPVTDGLRFICPLAVVGAQTTKDDVDRVRKECRDIWNALKTLSDIQKAFIQAAGGEPCLDDC